jgi:hypothetical protein
MVAVPSSDTNSVAANNSAAAGATSSGGLLAACGGRGWQSFLQACSSRLHHRFFQLSLDCTTLRWSWNKYVLLYFVDSLSFEPDQLRITLRCVLGSDLQLTFPDLDSWSQWATGLHAAMQLLTGLPAHVVTAQEAHDACIPAGVPSEQLAVDEQHGNLLGTADTAAAEATTAAAASAGNLAAVQPMTGLQQDIKYGMQLSPARAVAGSQISNKLQGASTLQHQLVRAALYGQKGMVPLLDTSTGNYGAKFAAGFAPAGSCRMLPAFLLPSRYVRALPTRKNCAWYFALRHADVKHMRSPHPISQFQMCWLASHEREHIPAGQPHGMLLQAFWLPARVADSATNSHTACCHNHFCLPGAGARQTPMPWHYSRLKPWHSTYRQQAPPAALYLLARALQTLPQQSSKQQQGPEPAQSCRVCQLLTLTLRRSTQLHVL